ncbi:MAG: response regulator [Dechloromonas sp.]|jgi:twitching motility two-component system response regulator PilH|uniref:response regulator n=1 Tax=Azonexus hydrophilus TaxID=418702 RepID=UPI001BC241E3|nr:response regulator [Azonexus hydrophilus]MBS4018873.1 response regulator [Dechloromonas sp.]MCA1937257.1 response regulator [Dechloromonas sp.]
MGILDQLKALFGRPAMVPASQPLTAAPAPERRLQPRLNAREGTRVLIIDDSKTVLAVLRKFLRSADYETIECLDAETGLVALREQKPELVFLDIMLPGMNGFAALRAIRRDPQTRETPVIMMSGNEQAMEQFFGTRIGADDFMKKPFSRHEVFFHIERLLDADGVPRRAPPRSTAAHLQPEIRVVQAA